MSQNNNVKSFGLLLLKLMKVSQDDFKATGNDEVHHQGHVILQFYSLEICKRMLVFLKARCVDSVKVVDVKEGDWFVRPRGFEISKIAMLIAQVLWWSTRCTRVAQAMSIDIHEMDTSLNFVHIGRKILLVGDETENVPLYYHMFDNLQIQFGREEFCLVTGLKFGVEYWADYKDEDEPIPFRLRVFPSSLDGKHITGRNVEELIKSKSFSKLDDDDAVSLCCIGILQLVLLGVEDRRAVPNWILRLANDRDGWDDYPWGSYVWPTLYYQLRDANVRRWLPLYATEPTNEVDKKWRYPRVVAWSSNKKFYRHMLRDFLHGRVPVERLIPDEIEAVSGWWVSSRAYFDGRVSEAERPPPHLNRQNHYEVPSEFYGDFQEQRSGLDQMMKQGQNIFEKMNKFMEDMSVGTGANKEPIIVDQHYGISDLSGFQSIQGGPSSFQTPTNHTFFNMGTPSQPSSSNWQSQMLAYTPTPNWKPPIPSHPGDAGLCDMNKLERPRREQRPSVYIESPYTPLPPTTELPKKRVGKTKKNCKNDNLSPLNLRNAFAYDNVGGDDVVITGVHDTGIYFTYENVDPNKRMNAWIEILIRSRPQNADRTVSKSGTSCVHLENNRFMIETDPHIIGTLDGLTRPYPPWKYVNWVYMPINVGGNHWVTGAVNIPHSVFYVFDSMESERTRCENTRNCGYD
ncbi:phospholipase-like protein [Tanacetum coccineum]